MRYIYNVEESKGASAYCWSMRHVNNSHRVRPAENIKMNPQSRSDFLTVMMLGARLLCQHNFEHNGSLKALSIMPV